MTSDRVKPPGKEDSQIDDTLRLERARSKVRSWQKWGFYFIIFGFITAFVSWERIFGYIFGLPFGTIIPNPFWITTGIIEIVVGFTLRLIGAQYERKIAKGEIPRLVS